MMRNQRAAWMVAAGVGLVAACSAAPGSGVRVTPRTNIITGSTGSTWYTIGSALAEKANLQFEGHPITAVPGAGGASNPVRVSMTGIDLGISYGPFLSAAFRGEAPFHEPLPQLRTVASLIFNTLHVLARPGLGVQFAGDIAAMKGSLRLGSGPPGSGELFCLTALLEGMDSSLDKWRKQGHVLRLAGTGQRFDDWKDDRLDIALTFVNDPSPQLTELQVTRPARFLSVSPELRRVLEERWGFRAVTVPSGTYPNQDYQVHTVALPSILFAVDQVDESIVYAVTRALYENQAYLTKVHPGFARWDPRALPDDVAIPLHPGARRYYEERGMLRAGGATGGGR